MAAEVVMFSSFVVLGGAKYRSTLSQSVDRTLPNLGWT